MANAVVLINKHAKATARKHVVVSTASAGMVFLLAVLDVRRIMGHVGTKLGDSYVQKSYFRSTMSKHGKVFLHRL
jgi:hypothetical protein